MNLLEALWQSDGRKRPNEKDIKAPYDIIQQSEKALGQEKTFDALLALARFGSLIGFSDSKDPNSQGGIPGDHAPEQLLTKDGVADLLQVSPRTVHNLMMARLLPYYRIGKTDRFRLVETLNAWKQFMVEGRSNRGSRP